MASLTQWTWVWVKSKRCWWKGRPGMLLSTGLQRVRQDWATELNWTVYTFFWLAGDEVIGWGSRNPVHSLKLPFSTGWGRISSCKRTQRSCSVYPLRRKQALLYFIFFICSGFCHTLKWNSHGFTCVPHPDPPSHLPLIAVLLFPDHSLRDSASPPIPV